MEKLKRIVIAGRSLPIKMDLNVLEHIQNEYGMISEFERDLLGLKPVRDGNGKVVYEGEEPVMESVEPSIKAIKTVLPFMINEGLAVEAEETGRSWETVSDRWVFANCSIGFVELADIIHEEFSRCFRTKK